MQVIAEHYQNSGFEFGADQPLEFESNLISLDIPTMGIDTDNGWRIVPLSPPQVAMQVRGMHNKKL